MGDTRIVAYQKGKMTRDSAVADVILSPGKNVEFVPSGGSIGQLRLHATADGEEAGMIVDMDPEIGGLRTTAYVADAEVPFLMPAVGERLYIDLAGSQTIKKGDKLVSDGLGEFKLHVVQAVDEGGVATFNNPGAPKFMAYEDRATAGLILAVRI